NLTFSVVAGPSDGQLVLNEDGSFHYTPITDFNRTDSFTYQANDGTVGSNIGTVTLKIDTDYTWYNCREPRDVNADNLVTPLDVLWVINTINNRGSHPLAKIRTEGIVKPFLDVNRDAHATPLDALWVINYLNLQPLGEGEGASETPAAALAIDRLMSQQAMRRERLERASRAVTAVTGSVSQPVLDNTPYWQRVDDNFDSIMPPARRSPPPDAHSDRDELFEQSDWLDFLGEDEAF
ncbi:MAG: Ig-like domain-containing protein, partial [Pirellulaceae bacterium]